MSNIQRNQLLDVTKILLSFIVVGAHVLPITNLDHSKNLSIYLFQGLARLTVPFFFIITGYFINNKIIDIEFYKKIFIRFLKLFMVWQLIYFTIVWDFYKLNIIDGQRFILELVYGIGHLWYLGAMLIALTLMYLTRNINYKSLFFLAIFLFLLGYILQIFYEKSIVENSYFRNFYELIGTSRNAIFYAYPYLIIGKIYRNLKDYIPNSKTLLFLLFVLLLVESYLLYLYNDIFFNILLVPFPLTLIIFHHTIKNNINLKIKLPDTLSLGIYLIHFYVFFYLTKKMNPVELTDYITLYLLVLIVTILMWFIINKINKKIKIFF